MCIENLLPLCMTQYILHTQAVGCNTGVQATYVYLYEYIDTLLLDFQCEGPYFLDHYGIGTMYVIATCVCATE